LCARFSRSGRSRPVDRAIFTMIIRKTTSLVASLLSFPTLLPQILHNPTLPLGIRTATKRAGGFSAGSKDSAGKRRGVKVGGGTLLHKLTNYPRRMGASREHNTTSKRHSMASRRECIPISKSGLTVGAYWARLYDSGV